MKYLAIKAIKLYQKHLSKRKKGGCSYRLYRERNSIVKHHSGCSGVVLRLIRRYGFIKGMIIARKRFAHCQEAHQKLLELNNKNKPLHPQHRLRYSNSHFAAKQAGFIDAGCDCPTGDCNFDCNIGDPCGDSINSVANNTINNTNDLNIVNNQKVINPPTDEYDIIDNALKSISHCGNLWSDILCHSIDCNCSGNNKSNTTQHTSNNKSKNEQEIDD